MSSSVSVNPFVVACHAPCRGGSRTAPTAMFVAIIILIMSALPASAADAFKYDAAGRRDPFVPLIGSDRPVNAGLENAASVEDIKLEGIALGPKGNNRAIMNGEMVKEGDRFGNLEIKMITKKEVVILLGGAEYMLSLPEEGGGIGGK
jgi:hypothetical protein